MAWFCDWLSGRLPLKTPRGINGGSVVYLDRGGRFEYGIDRRLELVGSYDTRMQIRTIGDTLEFSGNPTKFILGHNLYGFQHMRMILVFLGLAITDQLDMEPDVFDFISWIKGDVQLTRVDCTRMYRPDFAPPGWVPTWLSVAASVAHGGHQRVTNPGAYDGNTIYVGQHSRRLSLKLYDKASELRRHPPEWAGTNSKDEGELNSAALLAYAQDTLRAEVTIRSMELKARGLDKASAWSPSIGDALIDERLGKLSIPEDLRMTTDELEDLPRSLRAPYRMWMAGDDLRTVYGRRQFYRHRAALLKYGIDIAHVRPAVVVTERAHALGRPLRDYIAGPGLDVPLSDPARAVLEAAL